MKKIITLILTGITMFALGGCGATNFDAKDYVEAALDAKFHREYEEYAKQIDISVKEAKEQMEGEFNESLKTSMNEAGIPITEAEMEEYLKLEAEIREKVQYQVKTAKKDDEGNFAVKVLITPVSVYTNLKTTFTNKLTSAIQNGATENQYMAIFLEAMKECIANVGTGEPETMTLHVKWEEINKKKVYSISEKEWLKVDAVAIGETAD